MHYNFSIIKLKNNTDILFQVIILVILMNKFQFKNIHFLKTLMI
jgi:hypothetical protein